MDANNRFNRIAHEHTKSTCYGNRPYWHSHPLGDSPHSHGVTIFHGGSNNAFTDSDGKSVEYKK